MLEHKVDESGLMLEYPVEDRAWLTNEIRRLQDLGTITDMIEPAFVCPVFLRPKPGPRKWRLIHDLRALNSALTPPPRVRFEGWESILPHLREADWLYSVDLEDAYHHVPMHDNLASRCCFRHEGRTFAFRALPFGLSWSPAVFTKLLRPVLRAMRSRGFFVTAYLDDLFGREATRHRAEESLALLLQLLGALGVKVSAKHGPPGVTQKLDHLGLTINTVSFTVGLPVERVDRIEEVFRQGVDAWMRTGRLPSRLTMRLQGSTAAALIAVSAGKASTRALAHLRRCGVGLPELLAELLWWRDNLRFHCERSLHSTHARWIITTDASPTGYGAILQPLTEGGGREEHIAGLFTTTERALPQALREGTAVLHVLSACFPQRQDMPTGILVRTDSIFTVALVRGGSHSSHGAVRLTKQIHDLLARRNLRAEATHIRGVQNYVADALSRQEGTTEWPANPLVIQWAQQLEGPFDLDIFASAVHHVRNVPYVTSYAEDRAAAWCDAFSRAWLELGNVFANPPLGMIGRALLWAEQHGLPKKLCVLHPRWPSAVWWPLLLRLRVRYHVVTQQPICGPEWAEQAGQSAGRLNQWRWELSVLRRVHP